VARLGGLGKGLDALIPSHSGGILAGSDVASMLVDVPLDAIVPNPHQPRVHFDEETLEDLAESIRQIGVLQPVILRPSESGQFELVAGERRWRAARRAGLHSIPAIVRTLEEVASVEQALVENLHRQDLTALEEASAYQQLIEDFHLTHEQVALRVGKSRSSVTNTLRLMQLPGSVQQLVADGRISAGHARALLGSDDRHFQEQLARRVAEDGSSVRFVEDAVKKRAVGTHAVGRAAPTLRAPGLLELEELLSDHLDTKVHVSMTGKRGRIAIDFADLEDLERIYRAMTEAQLDVEGQ
jgi:ParB family transcriptional regulator, chromosome partitioning protein